MISYYIISLYHYIIILLLIDLGLEWGIDFGIHWGGSTGC